MAGEKRILKRGTNLDDHYRIVRVLGVGGFSVTYEAVNVRVGLHVAIKALLETCGEEGRTAFLREARVIGGFGDEPGIVHVLDFFESEDTAYIVMEFLDGTTLRKQMRQRGVFKAEMLFEKMRPIMETLEKIHRAGVLHGDISPDNIMVLKDGTFRLIDFGSASLSVHSNGSGDDLTSQGSGQVKDGYTPLEQYVRGMQVGPWSDVYSLAATIYTGLTGVAPSYAPMRGTYDDLKTPSDRGIAMDRDLEAVLMKALSVYPGDRFQSVGEFQNRATAIFIRKKRQSVRRRRARRVFLSALAVFGCLGAVYLCGHRSEVQFWGRPTKTLWISAPRTMPASDFFRAEKIVRRRLDVWLGMSNYHWKEENGKITVTIPAGNLPDDHIDLAKSCLAGSWKMGISAKYTFPDGSYSWTPSLGTVRGGDLSDPELKNSKAGKAKAVYTVRISDRLKEKTEHLTGTLSIFEEDEPQNAVLDQERNTISPEKESARIDLTDVPKSFRKLVLYDLTHEPMTDDLDFEVTRSASWENPSDSVWPGKYEKTVSSIDKDPVILCYVRHYPEDQTFSSGERAGTKAVLRKRLDTLKKPYALGTDPEDGRVLYVKIGRAAILSSEAEVMLHNGLSSSEWIQKELRPDQDTEHEVEKTPDSLSGLREIQKTENAPVECDLDGVFQCSENDAPGRRTSLSRGRFACRAFFNDLVRWGEKRNAGEIIWEDDFDQQRLLIEMTDTRDPDLTEAALSLARQMAERAGDERWTQNRGEVDLRLSDGRTPESSIYFQMMKNGDAGKDGDKAFSYALTVESAGKNDWADELKALLKRENAGANWTVSKWVYGEIKKSRGK